MKLSSTFTLKIDVTGNTGYNNQSQLELVIPELGTLKLGHREWDLIHCKLTKYFIKKLTLAIPSGKLVIYEPICQEIDMGWKLEFTGQGEWQGIHRGLLFGASGYGNFGFDREKATVSGSVFNLPQDVKCGFFGAPQSESDIAIAHPLGWCTYLEYNLRVTAMDKKYGYEEVRESASYVHSILSNEDKDELAIIGLKTWIEDINQSVTEYRLTATANFPD